MTPQPIMLRRFCVAVIGAVDDAKMQRVQTATDRQLKGANP